MKIPLISLRNVSAGYDDKEVLSGVSLDIYDGDFLAITGVNGGGKTTLIKVIMGLLPHSGTIEYSSELIAGGKRRIGYLPQQNIFDRSFPISVGEVVLSGLQSEKRFSRRYSRKDMELARNVLEMTGIVDISDRPIGDISGGQMQRALLGRALIAAPRLLILDEPTTYIDNRFESELYALLRRLNGGGMTIVIVSHDIATIADTVRRIVHVDGSITQKS